jgi:hypothetical protein
VNRVQLNLGPRSAKSMLGHCSRSPGDTGGIISQPQRESKLSSRITCPRGDISDGAA